MKNPRYSTEQIQQTDTSSSIKSPPKTLDCIEFQYEKITFRVYGILHGITGGLNRDYRDFIKQSMQSHKGLKLAEKGMKQLYPHCGIDSELEDWLVLRRIDCLTMGFQLIADPRCFWMITIDALREILRKNDPFIANNRKNISDLGESAYFHYLDEKERRELTGFLPSKEAIKNDLISISAWNKAIIPHPRHIKIEHPQWRRILLLERLMHIPCRSIHMFHFALAYAQEYNHSLVNLYVGETHNTDIHYLSQQSQEFSKNLDNITRNKMQKIINKAKFYGKGSHKKYKLQLFTQKINYLFFLILGALLPLSFYVIIIDYFMYF